MNTWGWISDQWLRSTSIMMRGLQFYGAGLRSYVESPEDKQRRKELENIKIPMDKIEMGQEVFYIYKPKDLPDGTPLVVMLHGCLQSPHEFALATGIHKAADKNKFAVLFPDQSMDQHPLECWNWQDPINQERGHGEAKKIVDMIKLAVKKYNFDKTKIYGAGLSSGGSMIHILANTYPEVFAATMAHSAPGFKTASSMIEGLNVMKNGSEYIADPDKHLKRLTTKAPMLIIHGLSDNIVNVKSAQTAFQQIERLNDLLDDGDSNHSLTEIKTRRGKKVLNGDGKTIVELVLVPHLGHAWGGGVTPTPNSDMSAPDSTKEMLHFFSNYGLNPN